jgi:hypothetical protein
MRYKMDPKTEIKEGKISKNKISDLFLWQQKNSVTPRINLFQDCLYRIENGQTMYTIVENDVLIGICWWIPPATNKANITKDQEQPQQMILCFSCSYYVIGKESLVLYGLDQMIAQNASLQDPYEEFILELVKEQKELLQKILNSGNWILDKN